MFLLEEIATYLFYHTLFEDDLRPTHCSTLLDDFWYEKTGIKNEIELTLT